MDLFSLGSWLWILIGILLVIRLINVINYLNLTMGKEDIGFFKQLIELDYYDKKTFYLLLPKFVLKSDKYEDKRRLINFLTAMIYLLIIACITTLHLHFGKN